MEADTQASEDQPVWARLEAFPKAPEGHGWMDPKGRCHALDSREALLKAISKDEAGQVILVWSEKQSHMILPEELSEAQTAVRDGRSLRMANQLETTGNRLLWSSLLLTGLVLQQLWSSWAIAEDGIGGLQRFTALFFSVPVGMGLLLWLSLALIPWYQSRKEYRTWEGAHAGDSQFLIPVLRFETWLTLQRAPVTRLLAGAVVVVWLAQLVFPTDALGAAGLHKPAYHAGEYWRLLTAPWLHGNWAHFLLNGLALLYLGKRIETFARWPHLLLVLLFAGCAGGILSAHFLTAGSVGLSGGLMGWLGFLLVFETLHRRLVTRSSRRRLLAGVVLTACMGLVGYRFIDNAAHLGGLLAGMAYAGIVFPASSSIHRPKVLRMDRFVGVLAGAVLVAGLTLALLRLAQT